MNRVYNSGLRNFLPDEKKDSFIVKQDHLTILCVKAFKNLGLPEEVEFLSTMVT
jgi:hypothetical protein